MGKAKVFLPLLLIILGFTVWQTPYIETSLGVGDVLSYISTVGGPTNTLFNVNELLTGWLIPAMIGIVILWGIALIIMTIADGDWSVFLEHILWMVGIALGLIVYIIPGIIIAIVHGSTRGWGSLALMLLGPVGSSIVATSPTLWKPKTISPPTTRLGAFPRLHIKWIRTLIKGLAGWQIILGIFVFFSVIGVISRILWELGFIFHLIYYLIIGTCLAYAIVKFFGTRNLLWIIVGTLIFIAVMSTTDILISALSAVGGWTPMPIEAVPAGFAGSSSTIALGAITILGGSWLGALGGIVLQRGGWSYRRIGAVIAVIVLSFLMLYATIPPEASIGTVLTAIGVLGGAWLGALGGIVLSGRGWSMRRIVAIILVIIISILLLYATGLIPWW